MGYTDDSFARNQFVDVFSQFGTVAHAVILATVDNASRRRGFIVMGSHQEAKAAMDGLSRKEIKFVSLVFPLFFTHVI